MMEKQFRLYWTNGTHKVIFFDNNKIIDMYIDYSAWESFEYKVSTLQLDVNNPRIRYSNANLNQSQIMKLLIENEKIYELAKKISEEGYFVGEEPIICIENDKKVVLEGNRRVASLKLLQNPKKFLSTAKANVLLRNIVENKIPIDDYKIRCHIAPNRLQANPIIYERHRGDAVKRWETGNQYSFVSDMYLKDGLSVDDICDVLNETRGNVLKTIKVYNLFKEGQSVLEKEGIHINTDNFNLTNLERFYNVDEAKQFLGICFNNDNGDITIKLPEEEFEKRVYVAFNELLNAESFSRQYNTTEDIESLIKDLEKSPDVDMSVGLDENNTRSSGIDRQNLEAAKNKITKRRKNRKSSLDNYVIPRDKDVFFDNEKLDTLFAELKGLTKDKNYAFSVLLRTYLEQSLYYFIDQNHLMDDFLKKEGQDAKKNSQAKVKTLIEYLKGKHNIQVPISEDDIMNILKFNNDKADYSSASLKPMLDFVLTTKLANDLDNQTYRVVKQQIELIKNSLDLSVHNLKFFADIESNKKAWTELEPLFDYLCNNIHTEE